MKPKKTTFKIGDTVVMHSCMESKGKNKGKIWICETDSEFIGKDKREVVFLQGLSGRFGCEFLQLVKLENFTS